jgi:hypothetical protein
MTKTLIPIQTSEDKDLMEITRTDTMNADVWRYQQSSSSTWWSTVMEENDGAGLGCGRNRRWCDLWTW